MKPVGDPIQIFPPPCFLQSDTKCYAVSFKQRSHGLKLNDTLLSDYSYTHKYSYCGGLLFILPYYIYFDILMLYCADSLSGNDGARAVMRVHSLSLIAGLKTFKSEKRFHFKMSNAASPSLCKRAPLCQSLCTFTLNLPAAHSMCVTVFSLQCN